jgi:hypothetical protein
MTFLLVSYSCTFCDGIKAICFVTATCFQKFDCTSAHWRSVQHIIQQVVWLLGNSCIMYVPGMTSPLVETEETANGWQPGLKRFFFKGTVCYYILVGCNRATRLHAPVIPGPLTHHSRRSPPPPRIAAPVERLYCKRPILCLASSKLLTPHPPLRPASVRGEDTLARWRGGWGVNILEGAKHSSVLIICKYFVAAPLFIPCMDQITIKAPNPQCRLYWCLTEFIDWRYGQSCWYFRPLLQRGVENVRNP